MSLPWCNRGGPNISVVVENKAPSTCNTQYKECQLCGEMLASAISRYGERRSDKLMFGALVSGLEVRFYKTTFSRSYLDSIVTDRAPYNFSEVARFPSAEEYALSLNKRDTREKIVRILHAIRLQLEQVIIDK